MRYSEDLIEEVRSRNNIVDVVSQYVQLQRKGGNYFGLCPFHHEKSPSFSVSPAKQIYYCFGCGAGGDVFRFLMEYENASFGEVVKRLAERAGVRLPEPEHSGEERERSDRRSVLLRIQKEAASWYYYQLRGGGGQLARQYLQQRGVSAESMRNFGLGYAARTAQLYPYLKNRGYTDELLRQSGLFGVDERRGMYDKFWNRVIFPIMDVRSRVIGFGGRVMGEGKPKYLNSPETEIFDKGRNLYGLYAARRSRQKQILICEGYMDVIAMHQAGFTNAVASLGTALTEGHASLLSHYTDRVLLLYDSDEAGIRAATRGIPILREAGIDARVVDLSPCKDPDEFIRAHGADAFRSRLDQAMNSFLFIVKTLESRYDLRDPQGKTLFFRDVSTRLLEFEDELERSNYIESISARYGIEREDLRKMVAQTAMRGTKAQSYRQPRDTRRVKTSSGGALEQSQKLVLTCLTSYPGIFQDVEPYLSEDDFVTPLCRKVAEIIFQQGRQGEIRPAAVFREFDDPEESGEAASLLQTKLPARGPEDLKRVFVDAVMILKEESLEVKMKSAEDVEQMQDLIRQKRELPDMQTQIMSLDISFE